MAFSVDSELLARLKSTAEVSSCWEVDMEDVAFLIMIDCIVLGLGLRLRLGLSLMWRD